MELNQLVSQKIPQDTEALAKKESHREQRARINSTSPNLHPNQIKLLRTKKAVRMGGGSTEATVHNETLPFITKPPLRRITVQLGGTALVIFK